MEIDPQPIKDAPSAHQLSKVVWWAMCHMCTLVRDAGKLGVQRQSSSTANDMALHYTLQYTNNHHHDCVAVSLDADRGRVVVASNSGEMTALSHEVINYYQGTYPTHRQVDPQRLAKLNDQINTDLGLEKPKTHAEMQLVELGYLDNGEVLGIERLCCLSCAAQLIVLGRRGEFTGSHGLFFDDAPIIPSIYRDPARLKALIGPSAYGYMTKFDGAAQQEFIQAICRPVACGVRPERVLAQCNVQRIVEVTRADRWRRSQHGQGPALPPDQ